MTASIAYSGSAARTWRLAFGSDGDSPGFGTMTLVDWWKWSTDPAPHKAYQMRVWRDMATGNVFVLIADDPTDEDQRRVKPHALFRFTQREMPADATVREVARHIARNAADARIPLPPKGKVDEARWEGAFGAALAFIERFGIAPGGTV